jgi:putative ABC transport system permease protein
MTYSLQTLWHERQRYLPGVLAVAFSCVLIALQVGLMIGLFEITSIPIDNTSADLWVGSQDVLSVDLGRPIPDSYYSRLAGRAGVYLPEPFVASFANYTKPHGGTDLCFLLGSGLDPDTLGALAQLTPELRAALTRPMTVVVDESDLGRLGLEVGGTGKINGKEVTLVGTVKGLKSLAAPWVLCSTHTAKQVLTFILPADHVTYYLAKCDSPARAREVADQLRAEYPEMSTFTADEFSLKSRMHWLTRTKAGIAIGFAALLGLLVGAVVTSQTLYAATTASRGGGSGSRWSGSRCGSGWPGWRSPCRWCTGWPPSPRRRARKSSSGRTCWPGPPG